MEVRALTPQDASFVASFIAERWGSEVVVSRGRVHRPVELPGFVATEAGRTAGLATYRVDGDECELVTIDADPPGRGAGSALVAAVAAAARDLGCRRLWLVTTNDNLRALRFYQRRGFELAALHRGAVDEARRLKPEISLVGFHGIPLRDELELELQL
jgi:N-acetylglutamate synthase-like GNAT family acetyltransferase